MINQTVFLNHFCLTSILYVDIKPHELESGVLQQMLQTTFRSQKAQKKTSTLWHCTGLQISQPSNTFKLTKKWISHIVVTYARQTGGGSALSGRWIVRQRVCGQVRLFWNVSLWSLDYSFMVWVGLICSSLIQEAPQILLIYYSSVMIWRSYHLHWSSARIKHTQICNIILVMN